MKSGWMDNKKMATGTNAMHFCICYCTIFRDGSKRQYAEKPHKTPLSLRSCSPSRPAWDLVLSARPHASNTGRLETGLVNRPSRGVANQTCLGERRQGLTVNASSPPAAAISGERIAKCAAPHAIQGSIVLPRLYCLAVGAHQNLHPLRQVAIIVLRCARTLFKRTLRVASLSPCRSITTSVLSFSCGLTRNS